MAFSALVLISLLLLQLLSGTHSATFTIINDCNDIIWPAILSNDGSPPLSTTGFPLEPGESETIAMPEVWSGRLWARIHCAADAAGRFSCVTGDCGSSAVECGGGNLSPQSTTLEFTLNGQAWPDTYVLSIIDGYNLPIMVVPRGGTGRLNCGTVGCVIDVNSGSSPSELRVTSVSDNQSVVGLKSACSAFDEPRYCCGTGMSNSRPTTCNPNSYSDFFKEWCPQARTFAYDDDSTTTLITCQSADYVVWFCPSSTSPASTNTGTPGSSSDNDVRVRRLKRLFGKRQINLRFGIGMSAAVGTQGTVLVAWAWVSRSPPPSPSPPSPPPPSPPPPTPPPPSPPPPSPPPAPPPPPPPRPPPPPPPPQPDCNSSWPFSDRTEWDRGSVIIDSPCVSYLTRQPCWIG